jgi:hypothetical protein
MFHVSCKTGTSWICERDPNHVGIESRHRWRAPESYNELEMSQAPANATLPRVP